MQASELPFCMYRSRSEFRLAKGLVILIFLLILSNPIVTAVDTTNIAVALAVVAMSLTITLGVSRHLLNSALVVLIFAALTSLIIVAGALRTNEIGDAIYYVAILLFWPIFWLVMFARYSPLVFFSILPTIYFLVTVVAVLSFMQFFLSPTLWGLLEYPSQSLEWASGSDFDSYKVYFRASSLLGSPQVLSLVCATFTVLVVVDSAVRPALKLLYVPVILGGAFLSGSKAVVFLLGIAFVVMFIAKVFKGNINKSRVFLLAIAVPAVIWIVHLFFEQIISIVPTSQRMFDLHGAIVQEQGDSRIDRFIRSFSETNPLVGHGYTHTMFRDITGFRAAESFIAKLYFHAGILPTLLLVLFFYTAYTKYLGPHKNLIKMGTIVIFSSLFVSTALESTAMYPIWGLIVAGCVSSPCPITIRQPLMANQCKD